MTAEKIIAQMKGESRTVSMQLALPIVDATGRVIGKLVPLGNWAVAEDSIVECFRSWRDKFMKMFFVRFQTSTESTVKYLRDLAIGRNDRLMFLIQDEDDCLVGHVGVSNVSSEECELDNLIRGVGGGEPRLIYHAEIALLKWCFRMLGVQRVNARVISYNWMAKALHEEVGFETLNQLPLRKREDDGVISHDIVQQSEANVLYTCDLLTIDKQSIEAKSQDS